MMKNKTETQQLNNFKVEDLLLSGEEILWQGKPNRRAYIMSSIFKMLPIALIWLIFDGLFIGIMIWQDIFSSLPVFVTVIICLFFVLHLTPVWVYLSNIITASRRHRNTSYLFTNARIIIVDGFIGLDVQNIYYTEITDVNLTVGIIDKMFKVGDISLHLKSGGVRVVYDVSDPYALVSKLQKIVNDIKADVYFPNELRPQENNGYQTKYSGIDSKLKSSSLEKGSKSSNADKE